MKKIISIFFALVIFCSAAMAEDIAPVPFTIHPPKAASAVFEFDVNPSTGYTWTAFIIKDGVIELVNPDGDYVADETEEAIVGQGGKHSFEITATGAGETIILFHYLRPSEGAPEKTLAYLVSVDEEGNLFIQDLEGIAPLIGTVISIDEKNHFAFVQTETHGEVLARFPEDIQLPTVDEQIKIWFNGVMTLSLPGQVCVIGWETIPPIQARTR